jgi:hypothetical protein
MIQPPKIPENLGTLDMPALVELYRLTGSKRVASAIHKLSQAPVPTAPIAPVVHPRPGGTPKGFHVPRREQGSYKPRPIERQPKLTSDEG